MQRQVDSVKNQISKALLFASFCMTFSDMWALRIVSPTSVVNAAPAATFASTTTSVSRALELTQAIYGSITPSTSSNQAEASTAQLYFPQGLKQQAIMRVRNIEQPGVFFQICQKGTPSPIASLQGSYTINYTVGSNQTVQQQKVLNSQDFVVFALNTNSSVSQGNYSNVVLLTPAQATSGITSFTISDSGSNQNCWWYGLYDLSYYLSKLTPNNVIALQYDGTNNLNIYLPASLGFLPAVFDLNNNPLTEINIGRSDGKFANNLTLISSPWPNVQVADTLSMIPAGTTQFTLTLYAYRNGYLINHLKNVANADSFKMFVYDASNNPIGSGINIPSNIVTSLKEAYSSNPPAISVGFNAGSKVDTLSEYPLSIFFTNITNWTPVSSASSQQSASTANVQPIVCDLKGQALTEINIGRPDGEPANNLTLISSPWSTVPVTSDLSMIPAGTTEFTLSVYGYDQSGNLIADINNIKSATGFMVYLYYANGSAIDSGINLPANIVNSFKEAYNSNSPAVSLGVNSGSIVSTLITYPISITFKNIGNWSPPVTLSTLTTALGANYSMPLSLSSKSAAGKTIVQLELGLNTVGDSYQRNYQIGMFTGAKIINADLSSILTNLKPPYSIMFVGVDSTGTMMTTLSSPKNPFNHFVVYVFDGSGNLVSGSPVAVREPYTQLPIFSNNQIVVTGYDVFSEPTAPQNSRGYPFVLNVTA